jgi:hypothetical protein
MAGHPRKRLLASQERNRDCRVGVANTPQDLLLAKPTGEQGQISSLTRSTKAMLTHPFGLVTQHVIACVRACHSKQAELHQSCSTIAVAPGACLDGGVNEANLPLIYP